MDYFDFDQATDILDELNNVDQCGRAVHGPEELRDVETLVTHPVEYMLPQYGNREDHIALTQEPSYQAMPECFGGRQLYNTYSSSFPSDQETHHPVNQQLAHDPSLASCSWHNDLLRNDKHPDACESTSNIDQGCTQTSMHGQSAAAVVPASDKSRKSCSRISRNAGMVLKKWFSDNCSHPYPTQQQHEELQMLTGLKRTQIVNWLANTRRRAKAMLHKEMAEAVTKAVDIPRAINNDWSRMTPMDRWKASPPENEFALVTDIEQAVANHTISNSTQITPGASQIQSYAGSVNSSVQEKGICSGSDTWSDFVFDAKNSSCSGSSTKSLQSSSSLGSKQISSFYYIHRRRRRRKVVSQKTITKQHDPNIPRMFQCTFCTESFSLKYDWQRHEKSLHLTLDWWTCCLDGGVTIMNKEPQCAFCSEPNPNLAHLETHNYSACQEKPVEERTFYRKDHLCQHLKLVHGCQFQKHMNSWRVGDDKIRSRCGFCSIWLDTWKQRVDHLANHFKDGLGMGAWNGDRGFGPEIEKVVQNSIPAHVIDHERRTMNPYVARPSTIEDAVAAIHTAFRADVSCGKLLSDESKLGEDSFEEILSLQANGLGTVDRDLVPSGLIWGLPDWNLWELTGNALHTHVQTCLSEDPSRIPSDQELRDYARMLIFGTMDPLDWTAADEAGWLSAFKYHAGIGEKPEQEQLKTMPTVGANTKAIGSANKSKLRGIPKTRSFTAMDATSSVLPMVRPGTPFQSFMMSSAESGHFSVHTASPESADIVLDDFAL